MRKSAVREIYDAAPDKAILFFQRKSLNKNISCGYSLEASWGGASNEYPQCVFLWRNKKNIL